MKEHDWANKNLPLYVSGDSGRAMRSRIDRHLADCAICRVDLQGQLRLFGALAVDAESDDSGGGGRAWKWAATAAAAVLVFAAGFVTSQSLSDSGPERATASPVSPSRTYGKYVAAPAGRVGMFRVLGAVAHSSEER